MRSNTKSYVANSGPAEGEAPRPAASSAPPNDGMNRKQRRASRAIQKKQFRVLVKSLQKKAAKTKKVAEGLGLGQDPTATFEQVVKALSPPSPVPDELPPVEG